MCVETGGVSERIFLRGSVLNLREQYTFAVRQAAHPNPLDYATRLELAFGVAAKPLRRGGLELSHKEALAYAESAAAGEKEFRETQRRLELADTIGQVYLTASRALDRGGLGLSRKDAGDFAQRLVLAHEALSEDDLALLVDALATKRLGGDEAGRTRAAPPTVDELVASAGEALKTSSSTNDIAPSSLAQANNRKALAFAMRPPADGGLGFDEEKAQTFAKQLVEESSPENVVPHLARIERLVRTFVGDQRHGELHLPAADGVDLALTLIGKLPPDGHEVREFATDVRKFFGMLWHDMDDGGFGGSDNSEARNVTHWLIKNLEPPRFKRFVTAAEKRVGAMRDEVARGALAEGAARAQAAAWVDKLAKTTGVRQKAAH